MVESYPDSPRLPTEERRRIIDTLVESKDIKDILLRNDSNAATQKEKIYNKQELIV
jgi:hypothetical protein